MLNKYGNIDEPFGAFLAAFKEQVKAELRLELKAELKTSAAPTPQFYHIKDVSTITGLTTTAIKNRIRNGKIKASYDSTKILIPVQEVNRIVKELNSQLKK